jgi:hypothetical protein
VTSKITITLTIKQAQALQWAANNSLASTFDAFHLFHGDRSACRSAFRAEEILSSAIASARIANERGNAKPKKESAK